ncbi:MAG: hypothetical protein A3G34_12975 [Candidatus Lindowbacteria bacterium RIFCSPLOWO2_12_FULL_62_27]|nr:MAG: hypothetical protein A3I06_15080 [Candidatus Lindowbacteria bacterium RIFCSPLOWO2_02_FULL_62_12]OGH62500.1 MAG: hypothetical protein A3G34_12975 [Candidatus Lindowbacteria bacterium RIFCSPLOWO2_12_FULL_62_27]
MNLPAFLKEDPKKLVRRLVKFLVYLSLLMLVLVYFKHEREAMQKEEREREERRRQLAETQKTTAEVNWEEQIKKILPDQEELLTPNVVPQLLIPPLLDKIQVPKALDHEPAHDKRYTAAYEFSRTRPISSWSMPATAAGLDVSPSLSVNLPRIAPPISQDPPASRQPKAPRGVGKTYILLP